MDSTPCCHEGRGAALQHFQPPGYFYEATLASLEASQPTAPVMYEYEVSPSVSPSMAPSMAPSAGQFAAPPKPGALPTDFVAYMDMGEPTDAEPNAPGAGLVAAAARALLDDGASYIVHVGDLSYARGYAAVWETWMDLIEPLSSRAPYMAGMGNHECNWPTDAWRPEWSDMGEDSGGECCVPAVHRFRHMPAAPPANALPARRASNRGGGNSPQVRLEAPPAALAPKSPRKAPRRKAAPPPANPPYWYSFERGGVHTFVLSTEHDWTAGSPQMAWLEADLAAVDRSRTPWLIGSGHRPAYTSYDTARGGGTQTVSQYLRPALEPALRKHRVDVMLYGHIHAYERSCPLAEYVCVGAEDPESETVRLANGTVHLTVGAGGHALTKQSTFKQQYWSAAHALQFGVGRLTALNATHARWRWYGVDQDSGTPTEADARWIVRDAGIKEEIVPLIRLAAAHAATAAR